MRYLSASRRADQVANKVQTCSTPFSTKADIGRYAIVSNGAKSTDPATPHDTPEMGSPPVTSPGVATEKSFAVALERPAVFP
jgi:hypothetical protein